MIETQKIVVATARLKGDGRVLGTYVFIDFGEGDARTYMETADGAWRFEDGRTWGPLAARFKYLGYPRGSYRIDTTRVVTTL